MQAGLPVHEFTAEADANQLGVYTLVGYQFSCIPDSAYPFPYHLVAEARAFDPDFLLLWCSAIYKSPNEGEIKTGYFALGRHVRNPSLSVEETWRVQLQGQLQPGLLLPTTPPVHGVRYRNPIIVATVMDGLTDEQRQTGKYVPRFEPFTMGTVRAMRWGMWARNHLSHEERTRRMKEGAAAAKAASLARYKAESNYKRKEDRTWRKTQKGSAVTFSAHISDSMAAIRAAAGVGVGLDGVYTQDGQSDRQIDQPQEVSA